MHKSKIKFLLQTRSKLKDTFKNEKRVLFFLKNKIKKILDIGCGTGFIYEWIKKHQKNLKYFGIDIDNIAIKYAKKKYSSKNFRCANFFSINKKFDLILLFQLFISFKTTKK